MPNAYLDHLDIGSDERALISKACPNAKVIYLAGMDKGLSGSHVWRARWALSGAMSKEHVLKIGPTKKLEREFEAYSNIASTIDAGSPHMQLFPDGNGKGGQSALRQEFATASGTASISLRNSIRAMQDPEDSATLLRRVFHERMKAWHFPEQPDFGTESRTLGSALERWIARIDLKHAYEAIGSKGLEESLNRYTDTTLYDLSAGVQGLTSRVEHVCVGPVHGDLHAQNVLVGNGSELTLIDFGWTTADFWRAVDFLMMECSLKFVVMPPTARLRDLLALEGALDRAVGRWAPADWGALYPRMHGQALAVVGAAVQTVRECAVSAGAVSDLSQYRKGLVLLTAALATFPSEVNRVYLLHSLAWQLKQL